MTDVIPVCPALTGDERPPRGRVSLGGKALAVSQTVVLAKEKILEKLFRDQG